MSDHGYILNCIPCSWWWWIYLCYLGQLVLVVGLCFVEGWGFPLLALWKGNVGCGVFV